MIEIGTDKKILDVTCGARTMWFDKHHPAAVYCDKRNEEYFQIWKNAGNCRLDNKEPSGEQRLLARAKKYVREDKILLRNVIKKQRMDFGKGQIAGR